MGHKLYDQSFLIYQELQNNFVFYAKIAKYRRKNGLLRWIFFSNAPFIRVNPGLAFDRQKHGKARCKLSPDHIVTGSRVYFAIVFITQDTVSIFLTVSTIISEHDF